MWKFLTKIFQKNTKICDKCGCGINPKKDAAICLHGSEHGLTFEKWVCEDCCMKIANDYEEYFELEDVNVAEEN